MRASRILLMAAVLVFPTVASAQPLVDVLSFLMTNRSVPTGDFTRDERAAAATSDAMAALLTSELGVVPLSASAGGFTYRLDPELGTSVRTSESFGPLFTERALTIGQRHAAIGLSYQWTSYTELDGRSLHDGSLVATAAKLQSEAAPFDVETVSLRVRTSATTLIGTVGLTNRLDIRAALPLVRVTLSGSRVDNYRGTELLQAEASGSAVGIGDIMLRAKYQLKAEGASGIAVGAEARLPTGDEENLLGAGGLSVKPLIVASLENPRVGLHGNAGYAFGGDTHEFDLSAAVTYAATPRLTGFGEISSRHLSSIGRLATVTEPHPSLVGVQTIRLTAADDAATRVVTTFGVKWNVSGSWLIGGTLLKPVTSAGLNADWVPAFTVDYSFGG